MSKNIKRIIAREGLIITVIGIAGLIAWIVENWIVRDIILPWRCYSNLEFDVDGLVWLLYPSYLVIRFIVWAIRTLREK